MQDGQELIPTRFFWVLHAHLTYLSITTVLIVAFEWQIAIMSWLGKSRLTLVVALCCTLSPRKFNWLFEGHRQMRREGAKWLVEKLPTTNVSVRQNAINNPRILKFLRTDRRHGLEDWHECLSRCTDEGRTKNGIAKRVPRSSPTTATTPKKSTWVTDFWWPKYGLTDDRAKWWT